MNKVQQALLKSLGLEIDQEFEFYDDKYKFVLENDNKENLHLLTQHPINEKMYEYDENLLNIINNLDKIHPIKKPILDEKEKKYLEAVLRPFKDGIISIELKTSRTDAYIFIVIQSAVACRDESMSFPAFKLGTMYKGMEIGNQYTLEELGLFE